jgi:glycosyltransferase involved in cell wall biosynthesis
MKILHVELGRHLYGGAGQVAYLLNGLAAYSDKHLLVCTEGADIIGAIDNPSVTVIPLPMSGDHDLLFINRLCRVIRTNRPDAMHIHGRRGDFLSICAAKLEHLPIIYSRRVDNPPRWLDLHFKFSQAHTIVTISEGIRQVLLKASVAADKIAIALDAVDTSVYQTDGDHAALAQTFGLAADVPILALVAQLIPRKGHAVLLKALPNVLAKHPKTQVLIFGKGPLEQALRELVQTSGLQDCVHFAGFRTNMATILPSIDLIVHPAFMEGLGVSLLEAAACGVPIVACNVGGIPEIVRDGINGYLVEPGDSSGLARAINALLDNPSRLAEFGVAGRQLVLEYFSIARMVAENHAVYTKLLDASAL